MLQVWEWATLSSCAGSLPVQGCSSYPGKIHRTHCPLEVPAPLHGLDQKIHENWTSNWPWTCNLSFLLVQFEKWTAKPVLKSWMWLTWFVLEIGSQGDLCQPPFWHKIISCHRSTHALLLNLQLHQHQLKKPPLPSLKTPTQTLCTETQTGSGKSPRWQMRRSWRNWVCTGVLCLPEQCVSISCTKCFPRFGVTESFAAPCRSCCAFRQRGNTRDVPAASEGSRAGLGLPGLPPVLKAKQRLFLLEQKAVTRWMV